MIKNHKFEEVECACGCGGKFNKYDKVNRIRKYIHGHNPQNYKSKTRSKKLSIAMKRRMKSDQYKQKMIDGIRKANTGISGEDSRHWVYGGKDYGKKLVYSNRERKCEECGVDDIQLDVHHIDKNTKNNTIDNLKILCIKCHKKLHKELKKNNG